MLEIRIEIVFGESAEKLTERKIYGLMEILFILNILRLYTFANVKLCNYDICILLYTPQVRQILLA